MKARSSARTTIALLAVFGSGFGCTTPAARTKDVAVAPATSAPPPGVPSSQTTADANVSSNRCVPSSVVTTAACPPRTLPPSNATSSDGCKSDAECKDGLNGRCVKNGRAIHGLQAPDVRSPLFAAPLPPPRATICTYDQCTRNTDCGPKARCACGPGVERHTCVPLDGCLSDAECGKDQLCACGEAGRANGCIAGNCRTSNDCAGRACGIGPSGMFCHTSKDACQSDQDCPSSIGEHRICDYDGAASLWKCRVIPPLPPG